MASRTSVFSGRAKFHLGLVAATVSQQVYFCRLADVSLFNVRPVTNPAGARASPHGDRAFVVANFLQREVAPRVSHAGNRIKVLLGSSGFLRKQLFVTEISTWFERHNSTDDSGKSPADQRLSNRHLVTVMCQRRSLRYEAL